MNSSKWYKEKRKQYYELYNQEWDHLYIWPPAGHAQSSEACETALRSGLECCILQANSPNEIEEIANAVIIRDYLKTKRNTAYGEIFSL